MFNQIQLPMSESILERVEVAPVLMSVLKQNLDEDEMHYLIDLKDQIMLNPAAGSFIMNFGRVSRMIERREVQFSKDQLIEIRNYYPGFISDNWYTDVMVRAYLLTQYPVENRESVVSKILSVANMKELVALYKGIYLLDDRYSYIDMMQKGVKTNMVNVFDAIALNNPFAAEFFDDVHWNKLVIKAIQMNRPIYQIYGIDHRKNEQLASGLLRYASESWNNGKNVTIELWRNIAGFVSGENISVVFEGIKQGTRMEKAALSKAILESSFPKGHFWLKENKLFDLGNQFSWDQIGIKAWKAQLKN